MIKAIAAEAVLAERIVEFVPLHAYAGGVMGVRHANGNPEYIMGRIGISRSDAKRYALCNVDTTGVIEVLL